MRDQSKNKSRWLSVFAALSASLLVLNAAATTTGTFLDRINDQDVRVAAYNLGGFIANDSGFVISGAGNAVTFTPPNARVMRAIDADVWAFQEIDNLSAFQVAEALDQAAPLSDGGTWHAHRDAGQVIASRFPIRSVVTNVPGDPREPAIATIDLPDTQYTRDLHILNLHLKARSGSSNEARRLASVDFLIDYLEDTRNPAASRGLPDRTPIIALGDYNTASGNAPVENLANGNYTNNTRFGPDAPPDWDGTPLTIVEARHNVAGLDTFTFRNGNTRSRLDWIAYTDSVLTLAQAFVLNTTGMSSPDLAAAGLERRDIVFDTDSSRWDHLPVVADYQLSAFVIPEPTVASWIVCFIACGTKRRVRITLVESRLPA
ncbi:MAG: endonuclease/exonuclease/phosphatase family protein [Planctomycetota bacterium]